MKRFYFTDKSVPELRDLPEKDRGLLLASYSDTRSWRMFGFPAIIVTAFATVMVLYVALHWGSIDRARTLIVAVFSLLLVMSIGQMWIQLYGYTSGRNYFRQFRQNQPHCLNCRYDLTNNSGASSCPQCGHPMLPPLPDESAKTCTNCGYDLTGNETGKCPECGASMGTEAQA